MTWIKTISVEDDEKVRRAVEAQRDLYPTEYSIPIHPTADGQASQIVASHSLIPDALIASWFNYINRVADGLGVGRD